MNEQNQLQVFRNEKFGEVRTISKEGEPWFVGKDMVECLGYEINDKTTYRKYVDKFCDKEDIADINKNSLPAWTEVIDYKKLGQRGGYLINENGVYSLIQQAKTKSNEYKEKFKDWLINNNLITNKICILSRKEIDFLESFKQVLRPFNYDCIKQYEVLDYRIDLYIKDLNIAIEYDENYHKDYSHNQQEVRQMEIEKELGCRFIRVNDSNENLWNCGFILKQIMEDKEYE